MSNMSVGELPKLLGSPIVARGNYGERDSNVRLK